MRTIPWNAGSFGTMVSSRSTCVGRARSGSRNDGGLAHHKKVETRNPKTRRMGRIVTRPAVLQREPEFTCKDEIELCSGREVKNATKVLDRKWRSDVDPPTSPERPVSLRHYSSTR